MLTQLCHMGSFFWGNTHSNKNIFKIQKRIIRIIPNIGNCESCRQEFKELQILTLPLQYVFSLLIFVNKNREIFYKNSKIHDCNKRFKDNLHLPSSRLTMVQRGVLLSRSKIYNHLPSNIREWTHDNKLLKLKLKRYLIEQTFYSLDEYYQQLLE